MRSTISFTSCRHSKIKPSPAHSCFHQRLETGADQFTRPPHSTACSPNRSVSHSSLNVVSITPNVRRRHPTRTTGTGPAHCPTCSDGLRVETRHAAPFRYSPRTVCQAPWRDHTDIRDLARLDQIEMHIEAVREHEGGASSCWRAGDRDRSACNSSGVNIMTRRPTWQPRRRRGTLRPSFSALAAEAELCAARSRHPSRRYRAGSAHARGLASIADDGDLLGLDQVEVGITIIIDAHGLSLRSLRFKFIPPPFARMTGRAASRVRHGP